MGTSVWMHVAPIQSHATTLSTLVKSKSSSCWWRVTKLDSSLLKNKPIQENKEKRRKEKYAVGGAWHRFWTFGIWKSEYHKFTVHMTTSCEQQSSTYSPFSFFSPSLTQPQRENKTMVAGERWRGAKQGYASSMACHCAYYVFPPSPLRKNFYKTTTLLSSKRPKSLLLSAISNNRDSYNTLVSEVALPSLFSSLCNL